MKDARFSDLVGKTISNITGLEHNSDSVSICCADGTAYRMAHYQDCCERVSVEDVIGDVEDLIGSPVVMAEAAQSDTNPDGSTKENYDSFTWTFYRIQTAKGLVVIRWYGESNGYYSETVNFELTD